MNIFGYLGDQISWGFTNVTQTIEVLSHAGNHEDLMYYVEGSLLNGASIPSRSSQIVSLPPSPLSAPSLKKKKVKKISIYEDIEAKNCYLQWKGQFRIPFERIKSFKSSKSFSQKKVSKKKNNPYVLKDSEDFFPHARRVALFDSKKLRLQIFPSSYDRKGKKISTSRMKELLENPLSSFTIRINPKTKIIYSVIKGVKVLKNYDLKKPYWKFFHTLDWKKDIKRNLRSKKEKKRLYNEFNSSPVAPGCYRSGRLGPKAPGFIETQKLAYGSMGVPKKAIGMHVKGYVAHMDAGDFHLVEYEEFKKMEIEYTHTYGAKWLYIDGYDPLKAKDHYRLGLEHNILNYLFGGEKNIKKKREKLIRLVECGVRGIELGKNGEIIVTVPEQERNVNGDLNDVLDLLEFIIDTPHYPVIFHCQGGRHKTGMVALALQCLVNGEWFYKGPKKRAYAFDIKQLLNLITEDGVELVKAIGDIVSPTKSKTKSPICDIVKIHDIVSNGCGRIGDLYDSITYGKQPPAGIEYIKHNATQYRPSNLEFGKKLFTGEAFSTPEQVDRWINLKEKLDKKILQFLSENGTYLPLAMEPANAFRNKYKG